MEFCFVLWYHHYQSRCDIEFSSLFKAGTCRRRQKESVFEIIMKTYRCFNENYTHSAEKENKENLCMAFHSACQINIVSFTACNTLMFTLYFILDFILTTLNSRECGVLDAHNQKLNYLYPNLLRTLFTAIFQMIFHLGCTFNSIKWHGKRRLTSKHGENDGMSVKIYPTINKKKCRKWAATPTASEN